MKMCWLFKKKNDVKYMSEISVFNILIFSLIIDYLQYIQYSSTLLYMMALTFHMPASYACSTPLIQVHP